MNTDTAVVEILKSMIDNGGLKVDHFTSMDAYLDFVCRAYNALENAILNPEN